MEVKKAMKTEDEMTIEQAIEIIEWLPAQNRWEEEAKDMAISALRDQARNEV